MPAVRERTVPHGTFTEHWIRATPGDAPAPNGVRPGSIEPYHARDREGPEARVHQGMGAVVHATLARDGRALREGADAWGGSGGAGRVRRG